MAGFILAILGIVILSLLLNIIIPSGGTKKYIKGILGIITLSVIVSPISKIFQGGLDIFNVDFGSIEFSESSYIVEEKGVFYYDELKLKKYLLDNGIESEINYVGKIRNEEEIDYINVILKNQSLNENDCNIYISKVQSLVAEYISISPDDIRVFYE